MNRFQFVPRIALALVIAIAFGSVAVAQERRYAQKGVVEIGGNASFSSISPVSKGEAGDATTLFTFGPRIGYFVADGFQVGFNPGLSFLPVSGLSVISPSSGESMTLLQLFVYPGYTIRSEGSKSFPFIELPIGYTGASSGGDSESGFSWGVRGGVKTTPVGALLVTVYAEYFQLTLNPDGADERYGFNYFSFGIGVGGFF
jgi:hypothetical protein